MNAVDVNASGRVTSTQPFRSTGSRNYQVQNNYVSAWINVDGTIGFSPSTRASKKDLRPLGDNLLDKFLTVEPLLGRYKTDKGRSRLKVFFIAEEIAAAGLGSDVVPADEHGKPQTINYSQLVVPLHALIKRQQKQIGTLEQKISTIETALKKLEK